MRSNFQFSSCDKLVNHLLCICWLIHGYHMSCIVESQESEVFVVLKLTCHFQLPNIKSHLESISPIRIVLLIEFILVVPNQCICPHFSSSPITNEILISIVDENRDSKVQEILQIITIHLLFIKWEEQVRHKVTLLPFPTTLCPYQFCEIMIIHELIYSCIFITCPVLLTLESNIIWVEGWVERISSNR